MRGRASRLFYQHADDLHTRSRHHAMITVGRMPPACTALFTIPRKAHEQRLCGMTHDRGSDHTVLRRGYCQHLLHQ